MAPSSDRLRVMTLSVQPVAEFRTRYSRWSGLFEALEGRYELLFGDPELRRGELWRSRIRHAHPRRAALAARVGFSEHTFAQRTHHAQQALTAHDGEYDVVLQLQTLFSPGQGPQPFVIYSDTTFARVLDEWPAWAPIPDVEARRFVELEREVSRRAHTIFAMSEHARRSFVNEYGCQPERVINVGTAMALEPVDLDRRDWTQPVALFVGLDFARKGGEDLLAVWPQVQAAVPDAILQIVGPHRSGRDLPPGVQWIGRVEDRAQLAELYRRAAVFTLPTYFDPMPWVIGEAMANGLACVVSPSCGIPEIIQDAVNGALVPAGNREALAEALIEMLADAARCERLGRRAHADISGSRWDDVADQMAPYLDLASHRA